MSGAFTFCAFFAVRENFLNLSVSVPEHVPMPITLSIRSTPGTATTHSRVFIMVSKEWFHAPVTIPVKTTASGASFRPPVGLLTSFPLHVLRQEPKAFPGAGLQLESDPAGEVKKGGTAAPPAAAHCPCAGCAGDFIPPYGNLFFFYCCELGLVYGSERGLHSLHTKF